MSSKRGAKVSFATCRFGEAPFVVMLERGEAA